MAQITISDRRSKGGLAMFSKAVKQILSEGSQEKLKSSKFCLDGSSDNNCIGDAKCQFSDGNAGR